MENTPDSKVKLDDTIEIKNLSKEPNKLDLSGSG